MSGPPIRVLVIDDSAYNRQTISSILERDPGIHVVGRAGDGDEGLKQVFTHAPDVITLDLDMPKMDGFTFLRILMCRRPTPVIVISGHTRRENVFRALELGALDFIAKPTTVVSPELREIERELLEKVHLVSRSRVAPLAQRAAQAPGADAPERAVELSPAPVGTLRVVAIGASTGGPPALQQVVAALDARWPICVLIAQHMPARFTTAFAERLDRASGLQVREARHDDPLRPGLVLVAPGASQMTVARGADGIVRACVDLPALDDRYVPSIDRLFTSVAGVFGPEALAVVLTGMGADGSKGARAISLRGGTVIAEAQETAVIFGMPEEAIRTGVVGEVLPLPQIPGAIARFARRQLAADR